MTSLPPRCGFCNISAHVRSGGGLDDRSTGFLGPGQRRQRVPGIRTRRCLAVPDDREAHRGADARSLSSIPREVGLIMRSTKWRWCLALSSLGPLAMAGCAEDNEAAFKQQAAQARGTIPGSRTAQAQSPEEYFEITPGVRGAGTRSGPRPDQGKGYPEAGSAAPVNSMWRMAMPGSDQGAARARAKK